jgi:hypothetical protein
MIENIVKKANQLKNLHDSIKENQDEWQKSTKTFIYEILLKLNKELPITGYVQIVDDTKNLENVNFNLGAIPSGILEESFDENNKRTSFKSYIGHIAFCQRTDGKIVIVIVCPYIENITNRLDNIIIDTFTPHEITESIIYKSVETFFDEMIKLEQKESQSIGFRFNSGNKPSSIS